MYLSKVAEKKVVSETSLTKTSWDVNSLSNQILGPGLLASLRELKRHWNTLHHENCTFFPHVKILQADNCVFIL